MSLHCLAILGSKNEPLYVCGSDVEEHDIDKNFEDAFGFMDDSVSKSGLINQPVSMRHEIMMHAAIDKIEELLGSHRKLSWKRFQRGSHWIGLLCPMEEYDVYAYVTSSDVKILALLERDGIITLKKRKEVDIKIMFTAIHDSYVKHTMNPFTKIKGKIETPCVKFEKNLNAAIRQYNSTVTGN